MKPVTACLRLPPDAPEGLAADLAERFAAEPLVAEVLVEEGGATGDLDRLLDRVRTPWLLVVAGDADPHPTALARMVEAGEGAALVYGDCVDLTEAGPRPRPLADCQPGSLEDRFDFGPLRLWSVAAARAAERLDGLEHHAFYDLRLAVQRAGLVRHLPEPLATVRPVDRRRSGERVFDYLTAARAREAEAERVLTHHLDRLGARLRPPFAPFEAAGDFPVEASVVIPVRNRVRTVLDAVDSALGQVADFPFNVLVVDNHSTDGTTELLARRGRGEPRLVHLRPDRRDLGIGGCWNLAAGAAAAGRYLVQLDSDDLYAGADTLARMVALLREERAGMAVGAYRLVDFDLREIPPGLVDHREWTPDNGPNNALRVGGLGAPRAFATELVRRHPFPNASYGEDYAVALRLSRTWRVGRLYEPVYLCRRWEDNSDADLDPFTRARYQHFKDRLRTLELAARRREAR